MVRWGIYWGHRTRSSAILYSAQPALCANQACAWRLRYYPLLPTPKTHSRSMSIMRTGSLSNGSPTNTSTSICTRRASCRIGSATLRLFGLAGRTAMGQNSIESIQEHDQRSHSSMRQRWLSSCPNWCIVHTTPRICLSRR